MLHKHIISTQQFIMCPATLIESPDIAIRDHYSSMQTLIIENAYTRYVNCVKSMLNQVFSGPAYYIIKYLNLPQYDESTFKNDWTYPPTQLLKHIKICSKNVFHIKHIYCGAALIAIIFKYVTDLYTYCVPQYHILDLVNMLDHIVTIDKRKYKDIPAIIWVEQLDHMRMTILTCTDIHTITSNVLERINKVDGKPLLNIVKTLKLDIEYV